jgi:hypothetical protein
MKRLLMAAGLAFAVSAVHAQESPAPSALANSQHEAEAQVSVSGHADLVYHGPHRYPMKEKGRHAGDPPIIDHSADTLVVEPTHSSITLISPTPP